MNLTRPVIVFLLLLVGIPLLELYFLSPVGSHIGALPTVGLSIFTALLGGALARVQGLAVLMRVRDAVERNQMLALELLGGALLLVAGLVLLLPGFVTDLLGFLPLIPDLRRFVISQVFRMVLDSAAARPRSGPDRG